LHVVTALALCATACRGDFTADDGTGTETGTGGGDTATADDGGDGGGTGSSGGSSGAGTGSTDGGAGTGSTGEPTTGGSSGSGSGSDTGGSSGTASGSGTGSDTTSSAAAVCGNDQVETGEDCDPPDDSLDCPYGDTECTVCNDTCQEVPGTPHYCGDGTEDDPEECDEGAGNSDVEPDACRENCLEASCGDGVQDTGEECDDGDDNSDSEADACRTNCVPASCGDGATDTGEECDDGNDTWGDTCHQCASRHYFVLSAPSTNSSGNTSVVRVTKRGDFQILAGPDPALDGIRELEVEPDGSTLYALQSNFSLVQQRIIIMDPADGSIDDEIALDQATLGYQSSPSAMALSLNGLLYVVVGESGANAHLISVNPSNKAITPIMSYGSSISLKDMTIDTDGVLFLTSGNEIHRLSPAYTQWTTWADAGDGLDSPYGITYDFSTDAVWVGNSRPSITAQIYEFPLSGPSGLYAEILGYNQPQLRGLLIDDDDIPLAPLGSPDLIVRVADDGTSDIVWDSDEGVDYPTDIKVVVL
jgi:cysteine-rich repeat protein